MSRLKKNIRNYTQVANDIINDDRMSLKAKGLYLYLVSKPDDWTFSARLIATQNKDSILSVNTGLQELETFGLLVRVHVQGGYDYEIFDEIKIHSIENRLNGKPTKQKSKIHLIENRPNISNKEPLGEEEEKKNNNSSVLDVSICSDISDYPYLDLFLENMTKRVKNPVVYRSILRENLLNDNAVNHNRTFLNYQEFVRSLSISSLPSTVSAFDVYENLGG